MRHLVGLIPPAADCFQDRHLLAQVDKALTGGGRAIVTQVLSGLGGVGKTQLAAALVRAHLSRGDVEVVVWVTARDPQAILTGLAQAGHDVCGADPTDPRQATNTFLGWLANTTGRWLVVLDDVADPADLTGLWPPASPTGGMIVTTRRRDAALATHGNLVPVGLFTRAEAAAYLVEKFADRPDRLGPNHTDASDMATDLGLLPLALGQAAAFTHRPRHHLRRIPPALRRREAARGSRA